MVWSRLGIANWLILGIGVATLAGCDRKFSAFSPKTPVSSVPGVASPSERIKALRELADKAPATTDPGQRESICRDMANQIRKEEDSILRGEILHTLAAYGGPTADAVLRVGITDPDADVRVAVCDLWGKRGNAEAAKLLEGVLTSDTDKDVRMAAARSLGHCHDPAAVKALGSALDDSDPAMQNRAMVALKETTGKDIGTDVADVNRWREYVKNGNVKASDSTSLARRLLWWN